MNERLESIRTLDDLRAFIHSRLCEKENLLAEQFRMRERQLVLRGRQCGVHFSLKGPRSVLLAAIWAADRNVVYFYDTRGERFLKIPLARRINA